MIKWLLFYLLIGMLEAVVGLDGLIDEHILGFIGYTIFWLPTNIWFAIQVLLHPGENILDEWGDYDD
jgi:hypothetical protein